MKHMLVCIYAALAVMVLGAPVPASERQWGNDWLAKAYDVMGNLILSNTNKGTDEGAGTEDTFGVNSTPEQLDFEHKGQLHHTNVLTSKPGHSTTVNLDSRKPKSGGENHEVSNQSEESYLGLGY